MNCPKCHGAMQTVEFAGVEVDRCRLCRGLWFDEFEKDELKDLDGAESLDIGSAEAGARMNEIDLIPCPRCGGGQMVRMVDFEQPHIWFEHCAVCGGSFFDAGEFRDLTSVTIQDFFRRFVAKPRT